jgi:hypothetical protein
LSLFTRGRAVSLGLLLLLGACAAPLSGAPQSGAPRSGTGESAAATTPRAQIPKPLTTQQVARPLAPRLMEVTPAGLTALPEPPAPARPRPAIIKAKRPLQCVPYARDLSKIALRGNAWTWWQKAEGHYERGSAPRVGSVLVLSKTRRLRLGHLAVVAEVVNSREIIVHQANWLNRGRIHRYTPVRDISKNNDWSVVRVWYTPGQQMGSGHYPAYGFIYPDSGETPELRQASN